MPSGQLRCSSNGNQCPTRYHCAADGRCWKNGEDPTPTPGDGGTGDDGGVGGDMTPDAAGCGSGLHLCGSNCVDDTSVAHCGSSCTACPAPPANGQPSCDGHSCGITCDPGRHACAGQCLADNDVGSCGTSCTPCPTRAHAHAVCDGTSCSAPCDVGYHDCSGTCVSDLDTANCGSSCSACAVPANGLATCDGTRCGVSCGNGYHACGATCASNSNPATCGVSCSACVPPSGGSATCDGVSCGGACPTGYKLCNGACIASSMACNGTCPTGTHNCSGLCESDTSVNSCGSLCSPCAVPMNATGATCTGGSCGFTCQANYADCDGLASNGCEASLLSDPNNCLTCGHACSVTDANALPICTNGTCGKTCKAGYHDCGGTCVSNSSTATCGSSCNNPCPTPQNSTPTCNGTSCGFACLTGYDDCNHLASDGCETNLSRDVLNCGACNVKCTTTDPNATAVCNAGVCGTQCNSGYHACSGTCVANTSVNSCGSSCSPCPARNNATSTCDGTNCGFSCVGSWADCDGVASNGCEANLQTDVAHCGMCSVACATPLNGSAACLSGSCGIGMCTAPYADCDGLVSTGCEANLNTDSMHCGSCSNKCTTTDPNATSLCNGSGTCVKQCNSGYHDCSGTCASNSSVNSCGTTSCVACPARNNATPTCNGTTCGFSCNQGFGDCDGIASNGCEVDLRSDPLNCSACGTRCTAPTNATAVCVSSACGFTCNSGYVRCGASCIPSGTCCTASDCTAPANGTPTCSGPGGSCGFSCNTSYKACGTQCIPTANCCTPSDCTPPPNASSTCTNGSCGYACITNYADCDGVASNGCEVNLLTSTANCGTCNHACNDPNGTNSCSGGSCAVACFGGFHNCSGTCLSNLSVNSCGSSCTACPAKANATAGCNGTSCTYSCNLGFVSDGAGGCTPAPPRLIAPLSAAYATSTTPTFKVALANSTDGARVTVCGDRACGTIYRVIDLTTSGGYASGAPTTSLAAGVYFWSAVGKIGTSVGTVASTIWELVIPPSGTSVATSWGGYPDFDGDGKADLAATDGTNVYFYKNTGSAWSSTATGSVVNGGNAPLSVGDVNGDGYADLIVSGLRYSCGSSTCTKSMQVIPGGPSGFPTGTPYTTNVAWDAPAGFLGDYDGDGYGDVGALTAIFGSGSSVTTVLNLFRGSATGIPSAPSTSFNVNGWGAYYNSSCDAGRGSITGGDLNGDGYADVVWVGSGVHVCYDPALRFNGSSGSFILGGSSGISSSSTVYSLTPPSGVAGYSGFGVAATIGDVNHDGYGDILVGGNDTVVTSSTGAFVYFGAGAPSSPVAMGQNLVGPGTSFGKTLGSADFNGDGSWDLVVGASDGNSAYVYYGKAGTGLVTTNSTTLTGTSQLGRAVAAAGDVNGDGYGDVVVSNAFNSGSSANAQIFLYGGNSGGGGAAGGVGTTVIQTLSPTVTSLGAGLALLDRLWHKGFCSSPGGAISRITR